MPARHGQLSVLPLCDACAVNQPQRVVLVIAVGLAFAAIDHYLTFSGGSGWFGYAPDTSIVLEPERSAALVLLIRAALVTVWTVFALWLFKSPSDD